MSFGINSAIDDYELDGLASRKQSLVGTLTYIAPEVTSNRAIFGYPVDIFSLGCIAYELAVNKPFRTSQHVDLQK